MFRGERSSNTGDVTREFTKKVGIIQQAGTPRDLGAMITSDFNFENLSSPHTLNMAENNDTLTFHSTNAAPDPRIIPARLAFAADLVEKGTAIIIRNYLLDGKLIQVCLYQDGRIEQRDTASHVTKISSLTIKITVNGMAFEIDQHAILSTPNDLIHAVKAGADEVHISQILSKKLRGIDTIAMVRPLPGV
jgi:hypothetical protein